MKKKMVAIGLAATMVVSSMAIGMSAYAEDSDPILIGAVYPMTGDLADSGKTMQQGIDMAIDEINEAGGIDGREIEVIYGDTQGDSATGMSEAERLITQENVDVLIGCYQSGVTATVAQIAEPYGVPLITENATSDALTANGYEYFFRLAPTNMMFVRDMIDYIKEASENDSEVAGSSVAVFTDNSEVGQQTVEWTEYWAGENDIEYLGSVLYTSGAADLSSEVLQLKSMDADVVVADCYVSDAILFTKTLNEQGYSPSMIICKGNGFTEAAYLEGVGSLANGVVVATEFVVGSKGEEITDKYYELYGEDMNGHSAEAYTSTWVLIDAFKNSVEAGNEINNETIKDELSVIEIDGTFSNGNEIILPYDRIAFEEDEFNGSPYLNQNLSATVTVTQIQDEEYVTIWPYEIAATDLVYPAQYQ
ncbi:MAG: ABC transporter substrate-binding protein [Lachnospiraceae bacterium]|nr:ABC transporter substrate-binding protein [Lachnospiraceae bacterium]